MRNIRNFLFNGLFICLVSLIMRTINVSFNIYVSNTAGAEAMGLFSLLSGVYGFSLTLATSGIQVATVRLVSEAIGARDLNRAQTALKKCILYSLFFGSFASFGLFFGADFIGNKLLSDVRTIRSLKLLATTLIPISLASVLNGYFTAMRKTWKNALINLAEQGIRIFSTYLLLMLLCPLGIEFACMGLALGGALAECGSFFISFFVYLAERHQKKRGKISATDSRILSLAVLKTALPIAFSAYARSGLVSIEHMLIPRGLCKHGSSRQQALASYGKLQSMVLPVVLFPAALIHSFSGLLVPELTECCVQSNKRQIRYICERVTQLTVFFAIGVSGILICFSKELAALLYPQENVADYIKTLAPLIPIMYMDTVADSMLKGLGEQLYNMTINIFDSLLSVILVILLLPRLGILGYVVTIYATELVNAIFSMTHLIQKSGMIPRPLKWVGKPLLCIVGATTVAHILWEGILPQVSTGGLSISLHITSTIALYFLFSFAVGCIDREDLIWAKELVKKDRMS